MASRQIYGTRRKNEDSDEKSAIVAIVIIVIVVEVTVVDLALKRPTETIT